MKLQARGYIASGEFNGNRAPQHLQNQTIKSYCDANNLEFVLSRAEYWINGSTDCQLWAALKEGFSNIVFYSIWQLPNNRIKRKEIYKHCFNNKITLHFAVEQLHTTVDGALFREIELLIQSYYAIYHDNNKYDYLTRLKSLL